MCEQATSVLMMIKHELHCCEQTLKSTGQSLSMHLAMHLAGRAVNGGPFCDAIFPERLLRSTSQQGMLKVRVLLFAKSREVVGLPEIELELPQGATTETVLTPTNTQGPA
jgi:hypothetical protein